MGAPPVSPHRIEAQPWRCEKQVRPPQASASLGSPLRGSRGAGIGPCPLRVDGVEYAVHALRRKDTPENPVLDALLEEAAND